MTDKSEKDKIIDTVFDPDADAEEVIELSKDELEKIINNAHAISELTQRKSTDLSRKEIDMIKRMYKFVPNKEIEKRFDLAKGELQRVVNYVRQEDGVKLKKNENYFTSLDNTKIGSVKNKTNTPGHMLNIIMRSLNEQERRDLMTIWEEGTEPLPMLRQLIAIQAARLIRGTNTELSGEDGIKRVVNEAADSLHNMIKTQHELEEGSKTVLELGDSFRDLVLKSQQKNKED